MLIRLSKLILSDNSGNDLLFKKSKDNSIGVFLPKSFFMENGY